MHGHHHHRPPGGARPQPPPPGSLTHPQLQQFHHHNLPNPNLYFQNPSFPIPQNPSFPIPQNPSFPIPQNPSFPIQQNPSFSIPQNPYPYFQNPTFSNPRTPNLSIEQRPSTNTPQKPNLSLDKIESAVIKAHNNLVSTGGTVSAWSVSESALLSLQVDSWSSLGFRMQQVPSLYSLMVIEGKVNSFIHCFVGSRKITTLYELDSAICKNEGIDMFEELKLGPLLKHPLVIHYFSIPSDTTEVHKITSEDLISRLSEVIGPSRRKRMQTKGFLEYVANKESLDVKEKLGVRITSLGYHLSCIQESRRAEESTLKNYRPTVEQNSSKQGRKEEKVSKPPPIDSQKKVLDERFSNILQRVEAFSPINDSSNNKHTRFISSSSEDENDADSDDECKDKKFSNSRDISCNDGKLLNKGVTSCPYPSALEEMNRLGLKAETDEMSPATGALSRNTSKKSSRKKRRYYSEENEAMSCKFPKTNKADLSVVRRNLLQLNDNKESDDIKTQLTNNAKQDESNGLLLDDTAMDRFIATWKDTCRVHSVTEVFKRMIDFYATHESEVTNKSAIKCFFGRKRKINSSISSCLIGLINIAIKSIKCGMWDNLYDTFQTIGQHGCISSGSVPSTEVETIDVNLPIKRLNDRSSQSEYSATVDDILEKVTEYVENNRGAREGKSLLENQLICLRRLRDCEIWLTEQFSVREFGSFGCGNFLNFLHVYCSRLPNELFGSFNGDAGGKSLLEVSVSRELVVVLLSQAASGLWANDAISKHHITLLLKRQFPILSLQVGGDDNVSSEDLSEILKQENSNFSSSVLFSATLLRSWYVKTPSPTKHHLGENTVWGANLSEEAGSFGSFLTKDAMDCLLKAPMLSDLKSWSHWDVVFAPSLGPLLPWLLNEVHTEELLCIVTGDGKILRIDRAVTVSDFLEAALRGSPFETAAKLLSLLPDFGGDKNMSLLKRHAHQAIEVILKNSLDSGEVRNSWDIKMQGGEQNFAGHRHGVDKAIPVASKFILDCLGYLPSEFCTLAADIFLYGLRPFTNDAPSAILRECSQINQRMMIHEIGLSLGILEWIADYRTFSSRPAKDFLVPLGISNSKSSPPGSKLEEIDSPEPSLNQLASHGNVVVKVEEGDDQLHTEVNLAKEDVSDKGSDDCCVSVPFTHDEDQEPALIVESIRHEEFGLVPSLTHAESSMLKKQHARLGRALHCLSQELYSQDSHFLLELVQNADDNIYPESVEPTLVFILQPAGIVVLNNEQGFSAKNIRALCDVGNSTKRGSSAGYIGQKGIGFKSVFRVTDAPEIHSNGFHVKFDISEGQIGFVLPTIVSPCDIDLYGRLVPAEVGDQIDKSRWKTCIVLPFKSKLTEGTGLSTIISKFSDLHPSLLLFLHRLRCIKFKNMLTNDCVVMRRETLGNGIVRVSHGKEKMSWLVASQKLQASALRPEVQNTEIAIAFTLEESSNGEYIPHTEQQPVFAFLPLRTYGLKFILQGDFVLPSSREEVDEDSAWNQWLLSELPSLFVSAQNSFCALPCFRESPGKAVVAYMSFVPLVGEVHGFFSHLPRMIISKLRVSNCMLLEGHNNKWVPPCQVLRGWDEPARNLLSGSLLMQHLGLGYLNKDIVLSDPLAKALGVRDYGPKILVDIISSICHANDGGMKSMGLDWLASCLSEIYIMLVGRTSGSSNLIIDVDSELNKKLRHIPFIPLSDGTYSSVAEGTIWLPSDSFNSAFEGLNGLDAFPSLYAKLRTVSSDLLTLSGANNNNCEGDTLIDNCVRLLARIGIQRLSAHDIINVHILPAISDYMVKNRSENLMIEYLSFIMLHLQSNCPRCCVERERIMYELRNKAFILTNHGYRRPVEVPIHFSKEFGNPVDMTKLIGAMDSKWLEIDIIYLKRTSIKNPFLFGPAKWREFFQELGVTDFVQIIQVEKNIANASSTILKDIMYDQNLISPDLVIKDWDSPELASLLASLSAQNDQGKCKYLLQVLDEMWDDCFSSKVTACCVSKSVEDGKLIKSSVIRHIHDVQWIVSSVDQELHYPKDIFHDCEAVRSLMGAFAPYSVPQARSRQFVSDMGFKTQVTLDDALKILEVWRNLGSPFRTSIAHMSKFYSFIWDGVDNSKSTITEEFSSRPSIFVPFDCISRREDVVSGMFLSRDEVYWHDPTGSVDLVKELLLKSRSVNETNCHLCNTLAQVYHGLHDFFVNECGVHEMPSFRNYIQILLQLSKVGMSSQAANTVFQIILKLADDINSGLVGSDDAIYLKEFLQKLENKVLPTTLDKWVSLHPKFGLVCWCDDKELRKQFKHSDNISFLYLGELSEDDNKMLPTKVSRLMQTIGVPSLSEVITREPIFYGVVDNKDKVSLVDWVLPFAQRYMNKLHPDKYFQLKQSGFEKLSGLQIIVVEKLFYRYALKGSSNTSNKRTECSCLLQENIFYVKRELDSHSLFLELSRLFFDGTPELHLANFLHMITTMAESGSTEDQTEFFILNSQKIPKLPDSEPLWRLSSPSLAQEDSEISQPTSSSPMVDEHSQPRFKRKPGTSTNWPPADWKTAPDFNFSLANNLRTRFAGDLPPSDSCKKEIAEGGASYIEDHGIPLGLGVDWNIQDESVAVMAASLQETIPQGQQRPSSSKGRSGSSSEVLNQSVQVNVPAYPDFVPFSEREQLSFGTPNEYQAAITGRLGEFIAFKYFTEKVGDERVNWVNKETETGLPYDIVIGKDEESKEYVEVKATKSGKKDWFTITTREWQFAVEKGESFSVAHVVLMDVKNAKVTVFKNPTKLCQQGMLQLAVLMSRNPKRLSSGS